MVLGTSTLVFVVVVVMPFCQGKPSSLREEDLGRNGCVGIESHTLNAHPFSVQRFSALTTSGYTKE